MPIWPVFFVLPILGFIALKNTVAAAVSMVAFLAILGVVLAATGNLGWLVDSMYQIIDPDRIVE